MEDLDMTPRYAPSTVLISNWRTDAKGPAGWYAPVLQYIFHPAGTHHGPLKPDWAALQLVTAKGDRWYGCQSAYINSELRMVVVGTPARDEVRMKWDVVPEDRR